jgi:RHS repeat-associated protein
MQIASTRLAAENNHRFPGQYYDAETGLHQNYFRDYEASIGRYVQRDPIGLDGGINVFGYVGAGPIGGIDVYGLFTTGPDIPKKRKGGHPYCEGKSLIAEIWGFSRCIEDCAIVHEERHLPDIMSKNPTLCHSVPEFDKKVVSASTQQEKDWTERNAYTAELKCLEEKEKKLCEDSNCRATVWRRIRFVEDILESEGW